MQPDAQYDPIVNFAPVSSAPTPLPLTRIDAELRELFRAAENVAREAVTENRELTEQAMQGALKRVRY